MSWNLQPELRPMPWGFQRSNKLAEEFAKLFAKQWQPPDNLVMLPKKLKDAVATIDVKVHDHLIIAGNNYYSFADNGLV